jgi:hypothetical protein
MIAMARRQYTANARKESSDTAIDVVTTAKKASGTETDSRIKGVMAYTGFHMLSSTLDDPSRSIMVSTRGAVRKMAGVRM